MNIRISLLTLYVSFSSQRDHLFQDPHALFNWLALKSAYAGYLYHRCLRATATVVVVAGLLLPSFN